MDKPTQEQIITAYKSLPQPVREFLADPDSLSKVLKELQQNYDLHIDVLGKIGQELSNFILGLSSAEDFSSVLRLAGLSNEISGKIIGDVNTKIFVPLRAQMRSNQQLKETAEGDLDRQSRIEEKKVAFNSISNQNISESHNPIMDPERELPVGEGPSINSLKNEIPPNLPGAMSSQQAPQVPIVVVAPPVTSPSSAPTATQNGPKPKIKVPAPDITSYSIDPYREPLDEDKAS